MCSLKGILTTLMLLLKFTLGGVFNSDTFEEEVSKINTITNAIPKSKGKENFQQIRDRFYRTYSAVDESSCTVIKSLGGRWGTCHTIDAEKDVCFDPELELAERGRSGDCLVYSFGIGKDWSFEEGMAELGCRVRTFDPTVEAPDVNSPNITYHNLALGSTTGRFQLFKQVADFMTLEDIRAHFGEEDDTIDYLKVDVEGYEVKSMVDWPHNGAIDNVRQMEIEVHLDAKEFGDKERTYKSLLKAFKDFNKLGFRLASYNPNLCQDKRKEVDQKYHSYFDVLFVRKS